MNNDEQNLTRCVLANAVATDLDRRYVDRQELWCDGPYGGITAFDKVMERKVGLYIAYPHPFTDTPAFIRQAKIRGRFRHPHLLPVFDFGVTADNLPYFTEPFVEARELNSLHKTWNDRRPFPLRQLVRALAGVCRAVAYAHDKGFCHLNLKPFEVHVDDSFTDVFVTGDWEEVVVPPSAGPDSSREFVSCTPAYAAPEQVQFSWRELIERELWRAADVYGLGGIIYYVLYDTSPNETLAGADRSTMNIVRALTSDRGVIQPGQLRPAFQTIRRSVSGLERIALKALEREPRQRYQAVTEMVEEIETWLDGTRAEKGLSGGVT